MSPARRPRWAAVRAVITDVDGVLTDGGLYYAESGEELKRFDVRDGQGLVSLREAGILLAIVTRRQSAIVTRRARELGITEVHQNATDKAAVVREVLARHAIAPVHAAYVGDDLGDLPAMKLVGLPIAVKEAVPPVRRAALYVTKAGGGHGAMREIAEVILASHQNDDEGRTTPNAARPAAPTPRRQAEDVS
jgi:YrbI family 3-deoxy-D-manno-octulosonate 8-phosphate phosphatase